VQLTQTELRVLVQVSNENKRIEDIANTIDKSLSQIYRARQNLEKYGFLHLNNGTLEPNKTTYSSLILRLLSRYPNLVEPLSKSGMNILKATLDPKSVEEIIQETNLNKSTVYKKIKQARKISALSKNKNNKFVINGKIWSDLKEYLEEIKKYEAFTDNRIPVNSVIYHKNENEIVFSNTTELKAKHTAFSMYKDYGIQLYLPTTFYYLPVKKLSKEDILLHSLYIVEKNKEYRYLTYVTLFYLKHRKEFSNIKHPILRRIKSILNGKTIEGYPTLEDIKEKCVLYDIKIQTN